VNRITQGFLLANQVTAFINQPQHTLASNGAFDHSPNARGMAFVGQRSLRSPRGGSVDWTNGVSVEASALASGKPSLLPRVLGHTPGVSTACLMAKNEQGEAESKESGPTDHEYFFLDNPVIEPKTALPKPSDEVDEAVILPASNKTTTANATAPMVLSQHNQTIHQTTNQTLALVSQAQGSHTLRKGYAAHFERRPQQLFNNLVQVVTTSASVRERSLGLLKVVSIKDIFAGKNEVFLGFGRPNTYLVYPDGQGKYTKFAAKSLRREVSRMEDTRGFIQSGVLLRFTDLPEQARDRLRNLASQFDGKKYWTCVNANCQFLEKAGFTLGERPLSSRYSSHDLLRSVLSDGLKFDGKPVKTELVKTTPEYLQNYWGGIVKDELLTFCRHGRKAILPVLEKSKALQTMDDWLMGKAKAWSRQVVAPALPATQPYQEDLQLSVSQPSGLGQMLRFVWGPHALFEIKQNRVDVNQFSAKTLTAFPDQMKKNWLTLAKQNLLFSPWVVERVRENLCPKFLAFGQMSEVDLYDMLLTDAPGQNNKFNIVITGDRIVIGKIDVRSKLVDWVLSKHVLLSGYDPDVRFAGECWKNQEGQLCVNRNSGTYRPDEETLVAMTAYLQQVFPGLNITMTEEQS